MFEFWGMVLFAVGLLCGAVSLIFSLRKKPKPVLSWLCMGMVTAGGILTGIDPWSRRSSLSWAKFVLLLQTLILAISMLVCCLRKKKDPVLPWVFLAVITATGILAGADPWEPWETLSWAGAVLLALAAVLAVLLLIRRLREKPCKALLIVTIVYLIGGLVLMMTAPKLKKSYYDQLREKNSASSTAYSVEIQTEVGFDVVDGSEPLEITTSTGGEPSSDGSYSSYLVVYDSSDLDLIFGDMTATAEDCLQMLNQNPDIDDEYRPLFRDFIQRMAKTYPDMDFRILYHNLETLKVVVCSKAELVRHSVSTDALACYIRSENTIYIPEGTEYIEGEWGYQILIHEFCHAVRCASWEAMDPVAKEERSYRISFEPSSMKYTVLPEAMNSVFSCSLLNYYEWDIAYQVPSNYLRIMLECMDNYTLADYINHGEDYFCRKLDEYSGYTNYAATLWRLIDLQRNEYQDSKIELQPEDFYPIYDFLCELYYPKYITADMSYEQAKAVADELVYKAFYDVPEECKTTPERFYEDLDTYLETMSTEALHAA